MDVILVPGPWLDASSWDAVLPMPGVGEPASASAGIGIDDWVAEVVRAVDAAAEPVVLVGHSGGGNVVWGAADARPDRVRRLVFVDTVPPPSGQRISEFTVMDGVIPFPGWDSFDAPDVADLDDAVRARVAPLLGSVPARVPTDPLILTDQRRYDVPVTLLMGALTKDELEGYLAQWGAYGEEYRAIHDAEVVRIGSGHWPQFSVPERLAELLVAAIDR